MSNNFLQSLIAWFILFVMFGALYQLFKRSLLGKVTIGLIKAMFYSAKLTYRLSVRGLNYSAKIIEKACSDIERKNGCLTDKGKTAKGKSKPKVIDLSNYRSK